MRGAKAVASAGSTSRLAAPETLAGLPRTRASAWPTSAASRARSSRYGEGLGGIAVLERKAGRDERKSGAGGLALPEINIDGATGTELATALGTLVTFERGGVSYTVLGSVPPQAAENAARGLR